MVWACTRVTEQGRRTRLPGAVGRTSPARRSAGGFAVAGSLGRKARSKKGGSFGSIQVAGPAWVAQGGSRYAASPKRSRRPGGLEKKLPEALATLLTPEAVAGRPVRLMFQD